MAENIEIEYKQLLSSKEYEILKEDTLVKENKFIIQENIYFETPKFDLREKKMALRIRVIDTSYELCLKQQRKNDILEDNYQITVKEFNDFCGNPQLMSKYFKKLPKNLKRLGSLKTERIETQIDHGLICIDKSSYGSKVDYEIEFEAQDYQSEGYFKQYLQKFGIVYHLNKISKIQRFLNEMNSND